MINDWPRRRVSEIATHSLGKMLDRAKNKGETKPYLRNANVRWFDFDMSDIQEMRFTPEDAGKFTAQKGDVLICEGGYPGRAAIWERNEPIFFQKALHRVRFHEPERSKWFLYYLLSKDLDGTLKNHFNGAGIQHFTGEALAQFELPLPPLLQQQRIVGVLDDAFESIATAKANSEKNLSNARALFESELSAVFTRRGSGWIQKSLEDVADANCSLSYGIVQPGHEYSNGMPVVRPTDLTSKVIRLTGLKRIDPRLAEGYARTTLRGGELLLCVRGSTGVVSIASPELIGANVTRGIVPIRFERSFLMPEFGFYLIRSEAVQGQIRENTYGAALMQINIRDLRNIKITFPPLQKQERIAAQLDKLDEETHRLASIYHGKVDALDALKKSILHEAFSGNL